MASFFSRGKDPKKEPAPGPRPMQDVLPPAANVAPPRASYGPLRLRVSKLPNDSLAFSNRVYFNPEDAHAFQSAKSLGDYVMIKDYVFTFDTLPEVARGTMGLNSLQRRFMAASFSDTFEVAPFSPDLSDPNHLSSLVLEVDLLSKTAKAIEVKTEDIRKVLKANFDQQFLGIEQRFLADVTGVNLEFRVRSIEVVNMAAFATGESASVDGVQGLRGILCKETAIRLEKAPTSAVKLIGGDDDRESLVRGGILGFDLSKMGIGGLNVEFNDIFRRAFASRVFPPSVVQKLGIQHVKGILLYGPPGTGKTLIARQIGKMLNGKEPKIVDGPAILNKFVGQSEENIRNLFKDAEDEYRERGEQSQLHVIIFDEIDAICKQRGSRSDGTGVGDTVVNQLLSKIDGVNSLNNILVIGMTNRKDLIDEALLRPGRFEVHIEIGLPDEKGREEIFEIHTRKMRENNFLDESVDLKLLAHETKNFSGAEIEGLVKSATSYAFNRQISAENLKKIESPESIKVMQYDFKNALDEVKPAFGVELDEFANCMRNGISDYSARVKKLLHTGKVFIEQVKNSSKTPLVSVLLHGPAGSGKTALAASLAKESGYPFVKFLTPESLVGYSEQSKCNKIFKVFEDATKSPLNCVVVDDLERLLDYVRVGPRFSNAVLQSLLVLFKREPPKGRRLLIIATTSNTRVLEDLEFMDVFNAILDIPQVSTTEEFRAVLGYYQVFSTTAELDEAAQCFSGAPISIKKLIMITEMAKQGPADGLLDRFRECMIEHATSQVDRR